MKQKYSIKTTTLFTVILLCFLCGLGFARISPTINGSWVWFFATITLVGYSLSRFKKLILLILLSITVFSFGWWRGAQTMNKLEIYNDINGQVVTIKAKALNDAVYADRGQLDFAVGNIELQEPLPADLIGEIGVKGLGLPIVYRGDEVLVTGKIFKKRGGQVAGISFAKMKLIGRSDSPIDTVRRNFAAGMQNVLPEPLASFGMGLLIGQRTTLDSKLAETLITVGLIHIVAVSGYNLTIIIDALRRIFRKGSRYQILVFSLLLIGIFLLFTGYSPSIVRAAVVSSLSLVAWFFGRKFRPILLLAFVAALTAGINPLYLWSNIGWYLSFTAFFGILIIAPLLQKRLLTKKSREKVVPLVLIETISAQLCTIPIILFVFGRLSIVSVLANVLVVPFVPLGMFFSLIAGISGMMHLGFSKLFALPAQIILDYMLSIASLLSRVPYANILVKINAAQMIIGYGIILVLALVLYVNTAKKYDTITDIEE